MDKPEIKTAQIVVSNPSDNPLRFELRVFEVFDGIPTALTRQQPGLVIVRSI